MHTTRPPKLQYNAKSKKCSFYITFNLDNVEKILNKGIDVVSSGLDQDSRGRPWETSSMLLGLSDKIIKIYGFCNVCGMEATKTYRKTQGGDRTQVGAADIYEPRCLKHWESR